MFYFVLKKNGDIRDSLEKMGVISLPTESRTYGVSLVAWFWGGVGSAPNNYDHF